MVPSTWQCSSTFGSRSRAVATSNQASFVGAGRAAAGLARCSKSARRPLAGKPACGPLSSLEAGLLDAARLAGLAGLVHLGPQGRDERQVAEIGRASCRERV